MAKSHGLSQKNGIRHPLFKTWYEMICRCEKTYKSNYRWYGGRGVSVCDRWHHFPNFVADMGVRPHRHTLDRINRDLGYSPDNCRWASAKEQMNNHGNNRVLVVDGIRMTMTQAAERFGVKAGTVWQRLKSGWDVDVAVKTPTWGKKNGHDTARTMQANARAEGRLG